MKNNFLKDLSADSQPTFGRQTASPFYKRFNVYRVASSIPLLEKSHFALTSIFKVCLSGCLNQLQVERVSLARQHSAIVSFLDCRKLCSNSLKAADTRVNSGEMVVLASKATRLFHIITENSNMSSGI